MANKTSTPANSDPIYEIRDSPIHGKGLYAAREIKKGERVIEYIGEKITKAESTRRGNALVEKAKITGEGAVYIFILNKTHDVDGGVPENDARLMNHCCEPSCEASIERGRIWYHSLRPIRQGEELSINYGFDVENWEDHPCRCGSPKCCGYIVAKEQWTQLKRKIAAKAAKAAAAKRTQISKPKSAKKAPKSPPPANPSANRGKKVR